MSSSGSPVIPREKLSAYQRWELLSFDLPGAFDAQGHATDRRQDEAARIEAARREGYASGKADGLQEGTQKSLDDARRLRDLLSSVAAQSRVVNQQLADDLLRLALEIARQMVRRVLDIHPEHILPLIEEALTHLSNTHASLTITLNPADAAVVRNRMAESMASTHWKIVEDPQLQRGGCVLQTATSHIDATLDARWQHLASKLGMEDRWLR